MEARSRDLTSDRGHGQLITGLDGTFLDFSRRQFKDTAGPETYSANPPWANIAPGTQHPIIFIQADDIDWESHSKGMHA
jgi:hypothetical protein